MKKLAFILLVFVVACKNEPKETAEEPQTTEVEEVVNELEIVMNFKTDTAGEFKLMLNNVKMDEFQRKNIHVIEKVEPATGIDELRASFGPNNISNNIYINFGNKATKNVEISNIQIQYGDKGFNIDANALTEYFSLNKYVVFDSVTNTIKTQRVGDIHNPSITLKRKYSKTLNN